MAEATRHSRRISPGDRRTIFFQSGGNCQRCNQPITLATFHVAHLRAASHGGPAILPSLEAWCVGCNLRNGNRDVRDTRVPLRDWQNEALPIVMEALTMQKHATVMAAPGGGKTLFAGAVFGIGQDAGLWSRLLVVVPRLPLVEQWKNSLLRDCHIALDTKEGARQAGRELFKMDGLCCTYQALLSQSVRERHRHAVAGTPTLVILDEVHHLGHQVQDGGDGLAWARAVADVVGDLRTGLNVAGVLNLSGTLFRTSPTERISTVEYTETTGGHGETRIQAVANYEIHPERLVREGLLRPPDLFRVGATVEIVDLTTAQITVSAIADLDDDAGSRVALRRLNLQPEWITELVRVTLQQLETRHRDSKGKPVKALIVTHRQDMARAFEKEVNRQMTARGLQPLAECVVSADGPDAYRRLDDFRQQGRVGVLCTVGMAGEGYDCPEIAVVTYATNVQTPQYIRQVVARGQRVTKWEREGQGPLSVAIILPDMPDLVKQFTGILAPMIHDIEVPQQSTPSGPNEDGPIGSGSAAPWSDKDLVGVQDAALEIVSAVSTSGTFDVDPALADLLAPILREVNLPESSWPRFAQAIDLLNQQRPFESPIGPTAARIQSAAAVADRPAPVQRPLTPREHHDFVRRQLVEATRWWAQFPAKKGGQAVPLFVNEIYRQAGIRKLDDASPEQLKRAFVAAMRRIQRYCTDSGTPLPRWARRSDDDEQ
jgi:superfamily II DNA or RNA helicase